MHAVVKCFFEYLIWSGKIPVQSHTFIMHCFSSNSYLCENVWSCCMHSKCRGLYGNLTPSKSHDFGLYVCYDLFCLHVEALQMIQPGQPQSDRDRLPHSRHTAVHIYPLLFRTVCGFFNRDLKQRRFWAMHVNRKWGLLPFYMPWCWQTCIAEFLFSFKRRFTREFQPSHSPIMQRVHFQLTSVTQKCCCLSSLMSHTI